MRFFTGQGTVTVSQTCPLSLLSEVQHCDWSRPVVRSTLQKIIFSAPSSQHFVSSLVRSSAWKSCSEWITTAYVGLLRNHDSASLQESTFWIRLCGGGIHISDLTVTAVCYDDKCEPKPNENVLWMCTCFTQNRDPLRDTSAWRRLAHMYVEVLLEKADRCPANK